MDAPEVIKLKAKNAQEILELKAALDRDYIAKLRPTIAPMLAKAAEGHRTLRLANSLVHFPGNGRGSAATPTALELEELKFAIDSIGDAPSAGALSTRAGIQGCINFVDAYCKHQNDAWNVIRGICARIPAQEEI